MCGQAAADAAHIGRIRQQRAGGDDVGLDRYAIDVAGRERKARTGADLQQTDIDLMLRELLGVGGPAERQRLKNLRRIR